MGVTVNHWLGWFDPSMRSQNDRLDVDQNICPRERHGGCKNSTIMG
jgi:hypothetical protein